MKKKSKLYIFSFILLVSTEIDYPLKTLLKIKLIQPVHVYTVESLASYHQRDLEKLVVTGAGCTCTYEKEISFKIKIKNDFIKFSMYLQ